MAKSGAVLVMAVMAGMGLLLFLTGTGVSSVSMWLFRVVICFAVTRLFAPRLEYAWLCMMGDNIFRAFSVSLVFIRR
jgi:hypothetical protein